MTQPQIPDSISSDQLRSFLGELGRMPLSPIIPALRFSDPNSHTGILDLYLIVIQIIAKAEESGPTPVQVLGCVNALLTHTVNRMEAIISGGGVEELLQQFKARHGDDIDDKKCIDHGVSQVAGNLKKIQAALTILEDLHSEWFTTMRVMEELSKAGKLPPMKIPSSNEHLLSDEIIESLGLSRDELEAAIGIKD